MMNNFNSALLVLTLWLLPFNKASIDTPLKREQDQKKNGFIFKYNPGP